MGDEPRGSRISGKLLRSQVNEAADDEDDAVVEDVDVDAADPLGEFKGERVTLSQLLIDDVEEHREDDDDVGDADGVDCVLFVCSIFV